MKKLAIAILSIFLALPTQAAKRKASRERSSEISTSKSWLKSLPPMRVQPVVGMSSFTYANSVSDSRGAPQGVKSDQGITAGALVEYGEGRLSYQSGLLYVQAGANVKDEIGVTQKVSTHYLAVPAYVKWKLVHLPRSTFFLKGGFIPAFFLDGKSEVKSTQFGNFTTELNSDNVRTIDLIGSAGAGLGIPISQKTSLLLEFTFSRGFVDFTKNDRIKSYNQGLLATAGASIAL